MAETFSEFLDAELMQFTAEPSYCIVTGQIAGWHIVNNGAERIAYVDSTNAIFLPVFLNAPTLIVAAKDAVDLLSRFENVLDIAKVDREFEYSNVCRELNAQINNSRGVA